MSEPLTMIKSTIKYVLYKILTLNSKVHWSKIGEIPGHNDKKASIPVDFASLNPQLWKNIQVYPEKTEL